jgi:hypothetical protein
VISTQSYFVQSLAAHLHVKSVFLNGSVYFNIDNIDNLLCSAFNEFYAYGVVGAVFNAKESNIRPNFN